MQQRQQHQRYKVRATLPDPDSSLLSTLLWMMQEVPRLES